MKSLLINLLTVATFAVFSHSLLNAQSTTFGEAKWTATKAIFHGKSKALRDTDQSQAMRVRKGKLGRKTPYNFRYAQHHELSVLPELAHQGMDPLVLPPAAAASRQQSELLVNVDGLSAFGQSPHDPSGEIGPNHYVQGVNATELGIFDPSDGSLIDSFNFQSIWGDAGFSSTGDPIIIYDEEFDRWFVTEIVNFSAVGVAVSTSPDPMGSYNIYSYTAPSLPDYPKYGIWGDALVITTNEPGPDVLEQYFLQRSNMINGDMDVNVQRVVFDGVNDPNSGVQFLVTSPVDVNGSLAPSNSNPTTIVLNDSSWGNVSEDGLSLFEFNIDWANETNSTVQETFLPLTAYDPDPCSQEGGLFGCYTQLGGGEFSGFPNIITNMPKMRVFDDHESMVFAFSTDISNGDNESGIRWTELRKDIGNGPWSVYQEGTWAPDNELQRFLPAIDIDAMGNIALAYSVTSEASYIGLRYTGRYASQPLGTMSINETTIVDGLSTNNSGGRYGDYAQMSVDPSGGVQFWVTSEYPSQTGVTTRIASFILQQFQFDLQAVNIVTPTTSDDLGAAEQVTAEFFNIGLTDMEDFNVSLFMAGMLVEETLVNQTLAVGDTYNHTFDTTVDMSAIDSYEISAVIAHPDDEASFNNETSATVEHLLTRDLAIVNIEGNAETCISPAPVLITFQNEGFETITSAIFNVEIGGVDAGNQTFNGSLETGEFGSLPLFADIVLGTNDLILTVESINGESDENLANNAAEISIELTDGEGFLMEVLTDEYPDETTWTITNSTGDVVSQGGPYSETSTLYIRTVCLDVEECYTLSVFDSFGDGICCDWGNGEYNLRYNGEAIITGGDFESAITHNFCGDGTLVSVEELALNEEDYTLEVFPNPTDDIVQIKLQSDLLTSPTIQLEVFDSQGKQIIYDQMNRWSGSYQATVSLYAFDSGVYFLRLSSGGKSVQQTLIRK